MDGEMSDLVDNTPIRHALRYGHAQLFKNSTSYMWYGNLRTKSDPTDDHLAASYDSESGRRNIRANYSLLLSNNASRNRDTISNYSPMYSIISPSRRKIASHNRLICILQVCLCTFVQQHGPFAACQFAWRCMMMNAVILPGHGGKWKT